MDDWSKYGPWALIVGGSEGIGLSFAEHLAGRGISLVLMARRAEPLAMAQEHLNKQYPGVQVETHALDVTSADIGKILSAVTSDKDIGLLVYNAGGASRIDLFLDAPHASAQQLIDLNCAGPAAFCHHLAGPMVARRRGGILLVSSMSGFAGSAYNASYAAAKAFEMTFCEGLWAELRESGVDVLCLVAGKTDTPALRELTKGLASDDGIEPMTAEEVAREGLENLCNGPLHIAGEGNRAAAEFLAQDKLQAIDLLSAATAAMYNRRYPVDNDNPAEE